MNQASATLAADNEPAPTPTFDAIPLGGEVRKAVDALGYVHPTPVQLAVFDPATRGKSLVVQARTGTGKTAAFGLPIIDSLVKRSQPGVQALILTPTRELALQVGRELEQLAQFRGTKIVPIYGGAPMGRQITALEEGAQVVVGTPGRVLDHLRRGTLDPSNIRIFVLDEADEMLSMGFQKELNAIIETLPKDRQGLYFSATIPPDVERLANNHLRDPEYVTLSSDQIGALSISHFVYLVREGDKRAALARIIEVEDPESAVVFCNTKDETERVAEVLKSRGYDADWLNGDLEQRERERVMQATREGKLRFLVATDVAARGIDISHLTHVINADFPESAEQYVHRTGRTGRAGRTGTAISMVGPKDVGHLYMLRLTYKIRPIERMLPTQGELRTRAEADMIAFLADAYAGKAQDPQHRAVARRLLTHDSAEVVIAGLLADHLGASSQDATQEAADARRAKNPPPARDEAPREARPAHRDARPADREPRTLRDGEKPAADGGGRRDRGRGGERDRGGERRERRPQSALSEWEPPSEKDDDAPLFRDDGTKPGLGPKSPPEQGEHAPRERSHDRGGRRGRGDRGPSEGRGYGGRQAPRHGEDVSADADTIDIGRPPLPQYHIEDEPTVVFGGRLPKPRAAQVSRDEASDAGSPPSRDDSGADDPAFTNVFLNVGRRDGLHAEDVQRLLVEKAGLAPDDVGHVRLRDRITFVGIRKEHSERAIKALIGLVVGDRTVNAEPARER
ncbi:MAG: DEAD/DEAH box helicase [Labilithrix sp.]|nr:DEAD/DEAH box helicase [Labilithrix sp.]MBX3223946.1 DEAD/DEAH box helicase [Labilithrix sp.]